MAPHSSTLAWKIPWTEEPGRLQSMGSRRVGHDWVTSLSLFTFMHWRRKWQPTPVFLPGESQGWGSLPSMGSHGVGHDWSDLAAAADSILKSRDITLPTKVHLVKAVVFPVVMYGCESWAINKVQHRRIDAFELWCWRRLLRIPWTARRSNQSCMFIGRIDVEAETPILWPPDVKSWLIGKDPDVRKDWGQEEKGTTEDEMVGWHHWCSGHDAVDTMQWTWVWVNPGSWWWTGRPDML